MNTKQVSSKQEKMVADYMGWNVVSGSGARPFNPGDVQDTYYLVECKTRMKEQDKIVFYSKHWIKIATEAQSIHKRPLLITDNGTQKSENTWAAIRIANIPLDRINKIYGLNNTSRGVNTITFDHRESLATYKSLYKEECINCFVGLFEGNWIAILPLSEFKKFYEEDYER